MSSALCGFTIFYTAERLAKTQTLLSRRAQRRIESAFCLWHTHEEYRQSSHAVNGPERIDLPDRDSSVHLKHGGSSLDGHSESTQTSPFEPTIFPAGKVLESRFRIVRLLGRGGMGEVYEAEDLVLKENVALKTLLPQIAADPHFRTRFRTEVKLARQVTHPNVCRIFDVFGDTAPSGQTVAEMTLPFMTMELLHGQTLTQFLEQPAEGPTVVGREHESRKRFLSCDEALPLVSQMVAALKEAHRVGVVHRDFKSSNVFLADVPRTTEPRVVVTDFGLARLAEAEGPGGVSLTGQNQFVGTPLYMSPEQVEGGKVTPATDIYALGVVLYELVTGTWPFVGGTPLETANLRLKIKPTAPKQFVPSLNDRWNGVILRCLERDPADRFQSVSEVFEALKGERSARGSLTRDQREQLKKGLQAGALAVAVLAGVGAAYRWWPRSVPGNDQSIAVVRFQNVSQNAQKNWIGFSLEEALTRELAASEGLRVIPPADVARMREELAVPSTGEIDPVTLDRIGNDLGVHRLVLADYEASGQPSDAQVRVSVQILDSSLGSKPPAIVENGHESDIFGLTDRIARDLRADLKVREISATARSQLLAALPNSQANRAYSDGVQKLGQFDPLAARDFLEEAVKDNPDAPFPHFALSEAWDILGYDQKALGEAKRAQETSTKLSVPEQRAIECRVLELGRENWDDAIAKCRGVWELRKSLEDGLRLAGVQFSAARSNDALKTLATLRKELPAPDKDDPRIDLAEAQNREALTQYAEMESAAATAGTKAEKRGARLLQAQALLWACVARESLDKLHDALKDCTLGNDLFSTIGDKISQARTLTNVAHILTKLGDPKGAAAKYANALALAKNVGSERDQCDALLNFGDAFYEGGKLDDATQKYKESLQVAEQSGNRGCQARATENLGSIARDRRDFGLAMKDFDQSRKLYSDLNMSADLARLQSNIGDLLWEQGDPAGARTQLEEAARRRRELGLGDGLGFTLVDLGDVLLAQDERDAALASYNEALAIKHTLHEDDDATTTEIHVAQAFVEAGKAADAEQLARTKLVPWCESKHDFNSEVFARDVLIRSLLAQGTKNVDAITEANALKGLLPRANDPETVLSARITDARALATQPVFSSALADLRALASEAHEHNFPSQELAAGLAIAESEKLHGLPPNHSSLRALAQTAKSKGYLLVARKASSLLALNN
jgi:serine/threonine protein kinase/tetratricopeptide (TPR) repeat protein